MYTAVVILLICSGLLCAGSILLMSPKGGLGMGITGLSGGNEYGSKKSVSSVLKQVAMVCAGIFVLSALCLPYIK